MILCSPALARGAKINLGGHTGHTGHTGYTGLWRFSTGCTVQFRKYRETTSGYFARQLVYSMISIPPRAISVQSAVCSVQSAVCRSTHVIYALGWNGFQQQQYQEKTYQGTQEEGDKPGDSITQLMICLSISKYSQHYYMA